MSRCAEQLLSLQKRVKRRKGFRSKAVWSAQKCQLDHSSAHNTALFPHGTAQTEKGAMPIWLPAPVPPSPAAAQHRCTRHFGARRELHTTALLLEVQGEGMTPSPLPRSRSWGALAATPRPIRPGHRRAEQKPTGRAVRFPAAPSPAHPPLQSRALSHGRSMSNHLKPRCRTSRFPRCPL